jgi:hypothetical protein
VTLSSANAVGRADGVKSLLRGLGLSFHPKPWRIEYGVKYYNRVVDAICWATSILLILFELYLPGHGRPRGGTYGRTHAAVSLRVLTLLRMRLTGTWAAGARTGSSAAGC